MLDIMKSSSYKIKNEASLTKTEKLKSEKSENFFGKICRIEIDQESRSYCNRPKIEYIKIEPKKAKRIVASTTEFSNNCFIKIEKFKTPISSPQEVEFITPITLSTGLISGRQIGLQKYTIDENSKIVNLEIFDSLPTTNV